MRTRAAAFVVTFASLTAFGCEREYAPPPNPPPNEPVPTNPPALTADPVRNNEAPAVNWSGSWSSDFGTVNMTQQGDQVTADYTYSNAGVPVTGHINGTVSGNHLDFAWQEGPGGAGSGHGIFTMSPDGRRFEGTWGQGESQNSGGNWNGTRL